MELFIEREFLDNFYIEFDHSLTSDCILKSLITTYGNKKVYVNYKEEDFEKLKLENEFFALIANTTIPLPVESIQDAVKKFKADQTIVLLESDNDWTKRPEFSCCLILNRVTFREKLNNIITYSHFKVDLSQPFTEFEIFKNELLPISFVQLTDGYLLKDKSLKSNVIPLLKNLFLNSDHQYKVDFLFKELKNKIKDKQEAELSSINIHLQSFFSRYKIKFKYYKSDLTSAMDFHDRTILTNFSLIDSGVGFSLSHRKVSNSIINASSIFEKFTYDRMGRIKRIQDNYIEKLESENFQSLELYKYP